MSGSYTFVTCPACGKRGYHSRKIARLAMRAASLRGMSIYLCRLADPPLWHWGHLPPNVKDGRIDRRSLGYTPKRPLKSSRAGKK